jgi:hypothetical protein
MVQMQAENPSPAGGGFGKRKHLRPAPSLGMTRPWTHSGKGGDHGIN